MVSFCPAWPGPPPHARAGDPGGRAGLQRAGRRRGVPPPATAAQGGDNTDRVGEWGAGFPGAAGLESLPVP